MTVSMAPFAVMPQCQFSVCNAPVYDLYLVKIDALRNFMINKYHHRENKYIQQ